MEAPENPMYSPEDIYGIVGTDLKKSYDIREVGSCFRRKISDNI